MVWSLGSALLANARGIPLLHLEICHSFASLLFFLLGPSFMTASKLSRDVEGRGMLSVWPRSPCVHLANNRCILIQCICILQSVLRLSTEADGLGILLHWGSPFGGVVFGVFFWVCSVLVLHHQTVHVISPHSHIIRLCCRATVLHANKSGNILVNGVARSPDVQLP